MGRKIVDITNQRFGRLIALSPLPRKDGERIRWRCRCDCGIEVNVRGSLLLSKDTQSCGCLQKERTGKTNRGRPYEWMLAFIRAKSIRKNQEFTLEYEDLLEFSTIHQCHYCQQKIQWNEYTIQKGKNSRSYFLDRKDSSKGYTKENCVVCCSDCNYAKGNRFSYKEMLILGKTIKQIHNQRNYLLDKLSPKDITSLTNCS